MIIGGGLAGLTAAVHLAAKGIEPTVLEADSFWAGGRLSGGEPDTFEHNGRTWSFVPDHGVHAVWGNYDHLRALLDGFTDTQLVMSEGEEWINRWGREVRAVEAGSSVRRSWLPAPFHYLQLLLRPRFWRTIIPLDFLSLPGFLFSMAWAVGFDPIKERTALDGLMMDEFFRLWTPNLRATFYGLGANLLAAPPETISLTAFIAALRFYTVLRRDAWQMQYFPSNSHSSLIQPLVGFLEAHGGQVLYGRTALRLEQQPDDTWRVIIEDDVRRGLRTLHAEQVILATSAPAAQRVLAAGSTAAEAAQMRFPAAVRNATIRLWFDAQPRDGAISGMFTGDFLPDNFFWLHRMYPEFAAWRENGGSALEVHIYGSEALMDQADHYLLTEAVSEVQRAFPELRGHFVHGVVRRNSRNHTVFRVPTGSSLHVQTPWPHVYACGDWVGWDTPALWMERAVITGMAAANQVLEKVGVPRYPIQAVKPPELSARILALLVKGIRYAFTPVVMAARARRQQKRKK
ncbi:MAG: NAD(P)/FAD-dependent oxidoreductase [Anaerolineae bacterium]